MISPLMTINHRINKKNGHGAHFKKERKKEREIN